MSKCTLYIVLVHSALLCEIRHAILQVPHLLTHTSPHGHCSTALTSIQINCTVVWWEEKSTVLGNTVLGTPLDRGGWFLREHHIEVVTRVENIHALSSIIVWVDNNCGCANLLSVSVF